MSEHRYILEPYKGMNTRFRCPSCKRSEKTFVRYIDTNTGEHLESFVGKCNRESNCGYHYPPKQYFQENNFSYKPMHYRLEKLDKSDTIKKGNSFIPVELLKVSLQKYNENNFITYLIYLFGDEICNQLISKYFIATSKHWTGSTIFWQIDIKGNIRSGKIMLYNPTTGKRMKDSSKSITWVHQVLKLEEFKLQQCLFGEHLLQDKTKPVAVVESEKTAIIASVYLPQFIWCATGGLSNLTAEKCKVLKGRKSVVLFPDLNGFEKWTKKAKELSSIANFKVSDLLERKATELERQQGFDLADYLTRFQLCDFMKIENTQNQNVEILTSTNFEKLTKPKIGSDYTFSNITNGRLNWDLEIAELEHFFNSVSRPNKAVKLNDSTTIENVSDFLNSHFMTVKSNNGKQTFLPYLIRIRELKQILSLN